MLIIALVMVGCTKSNDNAESVNTQIEQKNNQEKKQIDIFSYVEVNISGIAPYATAEIILNSEFDWLKESMFSMDKKENIINGDIIKIECNISDEVLNDNGYECGSKSKEYYVEGLDEYVSRIENLTVSDFDNIVADDIEIIENKTKQLDTRMMYELTGKTNYLFQYNNENLESAKLYNIILATQAQLDDKEDINRLYLVYEVVVDNVDYKEEGYFFFDYKNIVSDSEGTIHVKDNTTNKPYYCASEYEELYNLLVTPLEDKYYIGTVKVE